MRVVNDIYDKVDFDGMRLLNFKVKSLQVRRVFFSNWDPKLFGQDI